MKKPRKRSKAAATQRRATKRKSSTRRVSTEKKKKRPSVSAGGRSGGRAKPTPVITPVAEFPTAVKRKAPKSIGRAKPGYKAPKRSRHPEAVRSRKRRAEAKALREALAYEHERKLELRRQRDRERRRKKKERGRGGIIKRDERELAAGWLEWIRNDLAQFFPVSLELTSPEAGSHTPWLAVGRYDPQESIGYEDLARAFDFVAGDLMLEAAIHPQRLSQIRIVYADPRAKRGEGDSIVSQTGAWEFVISDLVGELVGGDLDSPDEGSLAARYDETSIPTFYVYFSSELISYKTAMPTQTVRLR